MHLGKKFYHDRWEAKQNAKRIKRETRGELMQAYKCAFCAGYHVGHRRDAE